MYLKPLNILKVLEELFAYRLKRYKSLKRAKRKEDKNKEKPN